MPRYYLIKGKPGLPVVNPRDVRVFLGREGGRRKGAEIEQVVQDHSHILDAMARGELERVAGPVIAESHDAAVKALGDLKEREAPKPTHKTKAGGEK